MLLKSFNVCNEREKFFQGNSQQHASQSSSCFATFANFASARNNFLVSSTVTQKKREIGKILHFSQ